MTSKALIQNSSQPADEALAELAKVGDGAAAALLLKRYRLLVQSIASRHNGASLETDDIVQEGFIGLLSAVYAFSPAKNAAFKTYAAVCITNAIRSAVKANACLKNSPLNSYISLEEIEIAADFTPEQLLISRENTNRISQFIENRLSQLEKNVIKHHIAGCDYKSIADKLGVSEKAVDNALQRVRGKIHRALNEN